MKLNGNGVRCVKEAKTLCKAHNLYIVEKFDHFRVYRAIPGRDHGTLVGKPKTPEALLTLVKQASTTTPTATHSTEHYAE